MSKQEKILKGIEKLVSEAYWYEGERNIVLDITKKMVNFLDSQGVVLKVDRDADCSLTCSSCNKPLTAIPASLLLKAGYGAFESINPSNQH